MTKLDEIKAKQKEKRMEYMASKDNIANIQRSILTTLLGEIESKIKGTNAKFTGSDADVVATIKKFLDNITETLALDPTKENLIIEQAMLSFFMPSQLDEAHLKEVIAQIITDIQANAPSDMGKVMGKLKELHAGSYDGALASKLTKQALL